jgi:uncharacterized alkaline shock family protein YloU
MIEIARTPLGRISLEPTALEQLVRLAAEEVDGARVSGRGRAFDVSLGDDGAAVVSVAVTAPRGAVLPELGKHVQARISEALVETLDVPPSRIDVTVEGIRAEVEG